MSSIFSTRMKKKAIMQDVIEFAFAFGFIFIIGIAFVSCQEMKSSAVEEDISVFESNLEYKHMFRGFLGTDYDKGNVADLLVKSVELENYSDFDSKANEFFLGTKAESGRKDWQINIYVDDERKHMTNYHVLQTCKEMNKVSDVLLPAKDMNKQISLRFFVKEECEGKDILKR